MGCDTPYERRCRVLGRERHGARKRRLRRRDPSVLRRHAVEERDRRGEVGPLHARRRERTLEHRARIGVAHEQRSRHGGGVGVVGIRDQRPGQRLAGAGLVARTEQRAREQQLVAAIRLAANELLCNPKRDRQVAVRELDVGAHLVEPRTRERARGAVEGRTCVGHASVAGVQQRDLALHEQRLRRRVDTPGSGRSGERGAHRLEDRLRRRDVAHPLPDARERDGVDDLLASPDQLLADLRRLRKPALARLEVRDAALRLQVVAHDRDVGLERLLGTLEVTDLLQRVDELRIGRDRARFGLECAGEQPCGTIVLRRRLPLEQRCERGQDARRIRRTQDCRVERADRRRKPRAVLGMEGHVDRCLGHEHAERVGAECGTHLLDRPRHQCAVRCRPRLGPREHKDRGLESRVAFEFLGKPIRDALGVRDRPARPLETRAVGTLRARNRTIDDPQRGVVLSLRHEPFRNHEREFCALLTGAQLSIDRAKQCTLQRRVDARRRLERAGDLSRSQPAKRLGVLRKRSLEDRLGGLAIAACEEDVGDHWRKRRRTLRCVRASERDPEAAQRLGRVGAVHATARRRLVARLEHRSPCFDGKQRDASVAIGAIAHEQFLGDAECIAHASERNARAHGAHACRLEAVAALLEAMDEDRLRLVELARLEQHVGEQDRRNGILRTGALRTGDRLDARAERLVARCRQCGTRDVAAGGLTAGVGPRKGRGFVDATREIQRRIAEPEHGWIGRSRIGEPTEDLVEASGAQQALALDLACVACTRERAARPLDRALDQLVALHRLEARRFDRADQRLELTAVVQARVRQTAKQRARLVRATDLAQEVGFEEIERCIDRGAALGAPFAHARQPPLGVGAGAFEAHEFGGAPACIGRIDALQFLRLAGGVAEASREVEDLELDLVRPDIARRNLEQLLEDGLDLGQVTERHVGLEQTAHGAFVARVAGIDRAEVRRGGRDMARVRLGHLHAAFREGEHDLEVAVVAGCEREGRERRLMAALGKERQPLGALGRELLGAVPRADPESTGDDRR